jgi:hypothetical protein
MTAVSQNLSHLICLRQANRGLPDDAIPNPGNIEVNDGTVTAHNEKQDALLGPMVERDQFAPYRQVGFWEPMGTMRK